MQMAHEHLLCIIRLGHIHGDTPRSGVAVARTAPTNQSVSSRSEEHTSELQSLRHLVCRLLLEKIPTNGRALICLALTPESCLVFRLPPLPPLNTFIFFFLFCGPPQEPQVPPTGPAPPH